MFSFWGVVVSQRFFFFFGERSCFLVCQIGDGSGVDDFVNQPFAFALDHVKFAVLLGGGGAFVE